MQWKKWGIAVMIVGGILWFVRYMMTPTPGSEVQDLGREHVSEDQVEKMKYNSNPPTSGPHLTTWVKLGIYTAPQLEGELIHSLEHGYIVIHYNCNATLPKALEASGSATNTSPSCQTLIKQLEDVAHRKRLRKLIVVPRPQLDHLIAVTAWDHIDTMDVFDEKRIERFIDFYRDHGPEQTME